MSTVANIFQYIFPVLVVSIAVVLLCFYLHATRKRAGYDVNAVTPRQHNSAPVINTISVPEDQVEEERSYDRAPPRYSTVDPPPPYSLFDPKLTSVWPGGSPPAYEMYPITLPLAPHHWTSTPPTTPQSPSSSTHAPPQRLHHWSSS